MDPKEIGVKYDKIALWWLDTMAHSTYGLDNVTRAVSYCKRRRRALDVGCGSSSRILKLLTADSFLVTALDVSSVMIDLAKVNNPKVVFHEIDFMRYESIEKYDFIIAYDSLFHLPLQQQEPALARMCNMLEDEGVLIYTFGDGYGEHESDWHDDKFYYSTIGIDNNLKIIMENECTCRHLELDQYPEKHVVMIVQKSTKN